MSAHKRDAVQKEKGQAMVETAIFSLMAVLLGFAILTLVPVHRSRTIATAAAYACTQFASQALDPEKAVQQAERVAWQTIEAAWSGVNAAAYRVQAWSGGPGRQSGCRVMFRPNLLFNGLLGFAEPGWAEVRFVSQAESWKARWP